MSHVVQRNGNTTYLRLSCLQCREASSEVKPGTSCFTCMVYHGRFAFVLTSTSTVLDHMALQQCWSKVSTACGQNLKLAWSVPRSHGSIQHSRVWKMATAQVCWAMMRCHAECKRGRELIHNLPAVSLMKEGRSCCSLGF